MTDYATFSEAWWHEISETRARGRESAPRGQPTLERRWVQFGVADALSFPVRAPGREFRDVIAALEATSLVGQFSVPELFGDRVKKFMDFTDGGVFHGAYGTRLHGRLQDLVDLLHRDPDTRQAVLTIFDSRSDLGAAKRDIPCTVAIQFMRQGGLLDMRVTMRSNDLWLGTPYDFTQFAVLQASIAQALGLQPGDYVHSAGSLHLYTRDLPALAQVQPAELWDGKGGFEFPLWTAGSMAEISARARDIALGRATSPYTEFEVWLTDLLWPAGAWYPGME